MSIATEKLFLYDEEDGALVFNSFQVEVALADIYEKVDFEGENDAEIEIDDQTQI